MEGQEPTPELLGSAILRLHDIAASMIYANALQQRGQGVASPFANLK